MVALVAYLGAWPSPTPGRPLPPGVTRERSGLVMADAFAHATSYGHLLEQYAVDGSAGPRLGWAEASTHGLVVGIQAHHGWAGWFASTVHAAGPDVTWHVVMTPTSLPSTTPGRGLAVFAVQTATTQKSGVINYIVVAAVTVHRHYRWLVGYAHGLVAGAATDVLWSTPWWPVGASTTSLPGQSVTVTTDGEHTLSVWLGNKRVVHKTGLALKIPPPFQAYLEVQSSAPAYAADFRDFWVSRSAPVEIDGLHLGQQVRLDSAALPHPISATAGPTGRAYLRLPPPDLVGTGTLTVSGPEPTTGTTAVPSVGRSGPERFAPLPYAGGDVLRVG